MTMHPPRRAECVEPIALGRAARRWKPYYSGPRELWLRCEGPWLAKAVAAMHYHWPFARGQVRFLKLVSSVPFLATRLRDVPFVSGGGVRMRLDIPSMHFLHLSGRLPSEPLELMIAKRIVRAGDWFVDAGAHWGLYAPHLLGALAGAPYWAVEPSAANAAFLRHCFAGTATNFIVVEAALSDHEGEGCLVDAGSSEAYLAATGSGGDHVKTIRLDSLLAAAPTGQPMLIKIDTEGHEAAVIRGGAGLRTKAVRPIFFLEYLPSIRNQTRDDVTTAIRETFGSDFRFFAIDQQRAALLEFTPGTAVSAGVRNMIALPDSLAMRLEAAGLR